MGLFNKFKGLFKKAEVDKTEKEELEKYDEGLKKTRNYFTDKISLLNGRYKKVTDEYFEELEEILIMADIGVNTVINFIDKLKKRVKKDLKIFLFPQKLLPLRLRTYLFFNNLKL